MNSNKNKMNENNKKKVFLIKNTKQRGVPLICDFDEINTRFTMRNLQKHSK